MLLILMVIATVSSCKKNEQTDFRDFLQNREVVYTGAVRGIITQPGNLQMGLKWRVGTDPTITKYMVFYNNGADSQMVSISAAKNDTIKTVIKGLSEYTYSFTVYSYDEDGNRSLPTIVNNARVYGPVYNADLINRPYKTDNPYTRNSDGSLTLYFNTPDTINTKTVINYTNTTGAATKKILSPDSSSITLKDLQTGAKITYQSFYIPQRTAIDTFAVLSVSTFPEIVVHEVKCDKSLFAEVKLPNDIGAGSGTSMSALWDGSVGPQTPPNVFFTDASQTLPFHFTFDLGKVYHNLSKVEETGSTIPPLNPTAFEVWGIADITNAATTLPGNDPGWADEAKAKGWVLLKECIRGDDGQKAMTFDLIANPPPVRYIRIRIKSAIAPTPSVMGELTFWNVE